MTGNKSTFPDWYQAIVREADMAEVSPVRGSMIIKPWGYGVWERIQQTMDRRIKEMGVDNAYFPLFIPLGFFATEAEHVDGFAMEMAVVTHHRLKNLDGKLAPDPDASLAFQCARALVFDGVNQPNGYTEPLLHAWRQKAKAAYPA